MMAADPDFDRSVLSKVVAAPMHTANADNSCTAEAGKEPEATADAPGESAVDAPAGKQELAECEATLLESDEVKVDEGQGASGGTTALHSVDAKGDTFAAEAGKEQDATAAAQGGAEEASCVGLRIASSTESKRSNHPHTIKMVRDILDVNCVKQGKAGYSNPHIYEGDCVIAVNGINVQHSSTAELRRLLRGPPDSVVKLSLRRSKEYTGTEEKTYEVSLLRYVARTDQNFTTKESTGLKRKAEQYLRYMKEKTESRRSTGKRLMQDRKEQRKAFLSERPCDRHVCHPGRRPTSQSLETQKDLEADAAKTVQGLSHTHASLGGPAAAAAAKEKERQKRWAALRLEAEWKLKEDEEKHQGQAKSRIKGRQILAARRGTCRMQALARCMLSVHLSIACVVERA